MTTFATGNQVAELGTCGALTTENLADDAVPYNPVHPATVAATKLLREAFEQLPVGGFHLKQESLTNVIDIPCAPYLIDDQDLPDEAGASGNNVYFQSLVIPAGNDHTTLKVAVKPFVKPALAAREYYFCNEIASGAVPDIETYQPVGYTKLENGSIAVITKYDDTVKRIGSLLFQPELFYDRQTMDTAMEYAGLSLGIFHGERVHNDYAARNVLWRPEHATDNLFVADFDQAEVIEHFEPEDQDEARLVDIAIFARSLYVRQNRTSRIAAMPKDFKDRLLENFTTGYVAAGTAVGEHKSDITTSTIASNVQKGILQAV